MVSSASSLPLFLELLAGLRYFPLAQRLTHRPQIEQLVTQLGFPPELSATLFTDQRHTKQPLVFPAQLRDLDAPAAASSLAALLAVLPKKKREQLLQAVPELTKTLGLDTEALGRDRRMRSGSHQLVRVWRVDKVRKDVKTQPAVEAGEQLLLKDLVARLGVNSLQAMVLEQRLADPEKPEGRSELVQSNGWAYLFDAV